MCGMYKSCFSACYWLLETQTSSEGLYKLIRDRVVAVRRRQQRGQGEGDGRAAQGASVQGAAVQDAALPHAVVYSGSYGGTVVADGGEGRGEGDAAAAERVPLLAPGAT